LRSSKNSSKNILHVDYSKMNKEFIQKILSDKKVRKNEIEILMALNNDQDVKKLI
jgi:hypothetical protein